LIEEKIAIYANSIEADQYSTSTRIPAASRLNLSDPAGVVESVGAYVHIKWNQLVEDI
jgi:hypothetical protein